LNTAECVIHSAKSRASKYESVLMIDNNKRNKTVLRQDPFI